MQAVPPTVSAMTVLSASSRSSAVRINSAGTSSNSTANGVGSSAGNPRGPPSTARGGAPRARGGQPACSLLHRLGGCVRNPGAHADPRRLLDAEPHCDRVRGLEADAADIAGETVGVLGHDLHGIGAVGLEDADRTCGA